MLTTSNPRKTLKHDRVTREQEGEKQVALVENPTPFTISTSIYPDADGLMRKHNLDGEYGMTSSGMLEAIHEALEEAQGFVNDTFVDTAANVAANIFPSEVAPSRRNSCVITPLNSATARQFEHFEATLKSIANFLTAEAYWLPIVLDALPSIVSRMREEEAAAGEKFLGA